MVKLFYRVSLPDELVQPFMQVIRDFDIKHDPQHEGRVQFESLAESDWPAEKMEAMLRALSPAPQFLYTKKADS